MKQIFCNYKKRASAALPLRMLPVILLAFGLLTANQSLWAQPSPPPGKGADFNTGHIFYKIESKSATVVGFGSGTWGTANMKPYPGTSIKIPAQIFDPGSSKVVPVTKIAANAFVRCTKLQTVYLPATLDSIHWTAFGANITTSPPPPPITKLYCPVWWSPVDLFQADTDSKKKQTFDKIRKTCIVYVPTQTLEEYKNNEYWKEFKEYRPWNPADSVVIVAQPENCLNICPGDSATFKVVVDNPDKYTFQWYLQEKGASKKPIDKDEDGYKGELTNELKVFPDKINRKCKYFCRITHKIIGVQVDSREVVCHNDKIKPVIAAPKILILPDSVVPRNLKDLITATDNCPLDPSTMSKIQILPGPGEHINNFTITSFIQITTLFDQSNNTADTVRIKIFPDAKNPIVDAGKDQKKCDSVFITDAVELPRNIKGTWKVEKGTAQIEDIHKARTKVTVPVGTNDAATLSWNATINGDNKSATVTFTNAMPDVDAGPDYSYYSENYGVSSTPSSLTLKPADENTGTWSVVEAPVPAPSVGVQQAQNFEILNKLPEGIYIFRRTVSYVGSTGKCSNSDDVKVSIGYHFVSDNSKKGKLDWSKKSSWKVGSQSGVAVPGKSDSVTISGNNIQLDANAACNSLCLKDDATLSVTSAGKSGTGHLQVRSLHLGGSSKKGVKSKGRAELNINKNADLIVGNSSEPGEVFVGSDALINIEQTNSGKGRSALRIRGGGGLYIEQEAVKSKGRLGVRIGNGGGLYIEQEAVKGRASRTSRGIHVRNGGLYIEQEAVKGNKGSLAEVRISSGGGLYIEQEAVKGAPRAEVRLSGGGGLYIEQEAVKGRMSRKGVRISGGGLYIQQAPVKGNQVRSTVRISNGGGLYIEQQAVKGAPRAEVRLSGGGLYIEQQAVKGRMSRAGIHLRNGGLYIEQEAVKGTSASEVETPFIDIRENGKLRIGNLKGNSGKGKSSRLAFGGLYIEQEAVKGGRDTAVVIAPNGAAFFKNKYVLETAALKLSKGARMIAMKGSRFSLMDGTTKLPVVLDKNSVLVDLSSNSESKEGTLKYVVPKGKHQLLGLPLSNVSKQKLDKLHPQVYKGGAWTDLTGDVQTLGGVKIQPEKEEILTVSGKLNKGKVSKNFTEAGFQSSGNPFPAVLDIDSLDFNAKVAPALYTYDQKNKMYRVYSRGISLNGASSSIASGEGFLLDVQENAPFSAAPRAQKLYPESSMLASQTNYVRLEVASTLASDETAVFLTDGTTKNFEFGQDIRKMMNFEDGTMNLYSVSEDGEKLAIYNTEHEDGLVIPLYFTPKESGNYTLSLTHRIPSVKVYLRDTKDASVKEDLTQKSNYTFTAASGDDPHRFNLEFSKKSGVEEMAQAQVSVYPNPASDHLFINVPQSGNLQIVNITGKVVKRLKIKAGINTVQIKNPGVYFLKITSKEYDLVKKVLIK